MEALEEERRKTEAQKKKQEEQDRMRHKGVRFKSQLPEVQTPMTNQLVGEQLQDMVEELGG